MSHFAKKIEEASRTNQISRVFDDAIHAIVCALSVGRLEDDYSEIMNRYEAHDQKLIQQSFGTLLLDYQEAVTTDGAWCDKLGEFFQEHNGKWGRDGLGQFFTPMEVCDLMARLNYDHREEGVTVNDPSCGSGRCLIAFDRLHPDNRMKNFYVAQDIDARSVKMTAINMFMHGMRGVVIHMDTLRMEIWGGYRVYLPEVGLGIQPLDKQQCFNFITTTKQEQPIEQVGQLNLF